MDWERTTGGLVGLIPGPTVVRARTPFRSTPTGVAPLSGRVQQNIAQELQDTRFGGPRSWTPRALG